MLIRFLIPDWSDRNEEDNQIIIVLLIVIIAGITVVTSMKHVADGPSEVSAEKAAMAYAEAIDYQYENPAAIYEFMTDDFRKGYG